MESKFNILLLPRAYRDIEEIYVYIASTLAGPDIALKLVDSFEKAIFSLEYMPSRGALRKTGIYADKGYRQLIVDHFIVLYRVELDKKQVVIITVKYSKRLF